MKTSKFNVLIVMVAAILMSFSYQVNAQKKGNGHGWNQQNRQGMQCNIPDLTEDQQKKMKKMKTANMKDMLQFRNVMAEKHAKLNTLRTADKVDMNAINKIIDEIGASKTKMMKKREAHRQEVRQILTDEQRVYFDSRRGNGFHGGKGHGNKMGMSGKGKKGCRNM